MKTIMLEVVVHNKDGLHVRPSMLIAEVASGFSSDIYLTCDGIRTPAKTGMEILLLRAVAGATVVVEACGTDAEAAIQAMKEVIEREFDFPRQG